MRKRWIVILKISVGVFLLWLVLKHVDIGESIALIRKTDPVMLAAALLCVVVANLISVARWRMLLTTAGAWVRFWRLVLVNLVGIFFSTFLPGSVGGDVFKVLYLSQPRDSAPLLSATIVTRILGMAALFGGGLLIVPFADIQLRSQPWWPLYILMLFGGLAASLAPLLPGPDRLLQRILLWLHFPGKLRRLLDSMLDPVARWRTDRYRAACTFLLAFLYQLAGPVLVLYFCARSLGIEVSPVDTATIAVVASVAFALPISLNGIGVAEGVYVVLYGILGVSAEHALLLAVLFRLVFSVQALAGGLAYFVVQRHPVVGTADAAPKG